MRHIYGMICLVGILLLTGCGGVADVVSGASPTERPTAFAVEVTPKAADGNAEQTPPSIPTAPIVVTPIPEQAPPAGAPPGGPAENEIVIDVPAAEMAVTSPLTIRGSANYWPFEATLVAELKDAAGNTLAMKPVMVQSPGGYTGGPWADELVFTPPLSAQEGTLSVYETSAKDGSITTIATTRVRLEPANDAGMPIRFDHPAEGAAVATPLYVSFGGARGDEQLSMRLRMADGTTREEAVRADLGYVVAVVPVEQVPGPATLEVVQRDGTVVGRRSVRIVAPDATQVVKVAWVTPNGDDVVFEERRVARTAQIGAAALDVLTWGPLPNAEGYGTALPTPAEVLSYAGREIGWGPRVRLLKLTITDGVALADFGPELRAYGGGAARVGMIRKQIEQTLLQFPSVKQVVIAIDGQTEGVLEP